MGRSKTTRVNPPLLTSDPTQKPGSSHDIPESGFSATQTEPSPLKHNPVIHLQRMVGNQAVLGLLHQKRRSFTSSRPIADKGFLQRKLPSYAAFIKGGKKITKQDESIFTGLPAQKALNEVRKTFPASGFDTKANILAAYQAYEQSPSVQTLIELYDTITYWEVLNNVNADQDWYQSVRFYVGGVKDSIQQEIKTETKNQFGTQQDLDQLENDTKSRDKEDQEWRVFMPDYMKKLGIAPRYFHKHLMDYPERLENLQKFYVGIQTGALKDAETTYKLISDIPGMYLIKPMIVHHFAAGAGLGSLVGTQSQQNGELTDEEIDAIETYSSGEYLNMNADLRATGSMPVLSNDETPMDINQFDSFLSWHEILGNRKTARKTTSELAVSGMNKLPPFKGIAYRGLVWQPGGYFDVIQPGAMIVDLAFQSASPSLKGVQAFMDSQKGTKHVYFMIHTKSAVNIMAYAQLAKEG